MSKHIYALLLVLSSVLLGNLAHANPEDSEITIRHEKAETYYEYRVNGVLVEIKVVPIKGATYYLVPSESGDGAFIQDDESNLLVPKWVIFRW